MDVITSSSSFSSIHQLRSFMSVLSKKSKLYFYQDNSEKMITTILSLWWSSSMISGFCVCSYFILWIHKLLCWRVWGKWVVWVVRAMLQLPQRIFCVWECHKWLEKDVFVKVGSLASTLTCSSLLTFWDRAKNFSPMQFNKKKIS